MKRRTLAIIICIMLSIALVGCGSSDSNNEKETAPKEEKEETQEAEKEETEEKTEEKAEEAEEVEEEKEAEASAADFSQTIVDKDGVKFEITGVEEDGFWGYTWNVYIENNTDQSLMYSLDDVSVNGVMVDPFWATEVEAGKKSNNDISWSGSALEEVGIDEVTVVDFQLRISDSEDIFADPLVEENFTVYPLGEAAASTMERTSSESDIVLFDNDACTMIVTGYNPDGMFGFELNAYLENKTDKTLMFSIDNASVNGFMADPFWASSVAPGKKSSEDITWMSSTLEENGIEKVESIEMTINVYNEDDWEDRIIEDVFTVNIE